MVKTLDEFDRAASTIAPATLDYLASLEWILAQENLCLVGPAPARVTCSSRSATSPSRPNAT